MWQSVIAGATLALGVYRAGAADLPAGIGPAPSALTAGQPPARLVLTGEHTSAPGLQRAETGLTWAIGVHVAVQLSYARTATAPPMRGDHEDGVVTRVRLGF